MNTIGAIRIYLGSRYTERAEIGLYTPAVGNSEIRWSEAPLTGVSETYNPSMLIKNGIGGLSSSLEDTYGGNQETVNDINFSVTGAAQLPLRLQELNIQPSGKTVEYIEFIGTDADSDSVSITVMSTFTIEDMDGNEFDTKFTAKSSFVYKRNKLLAIRLSTSTFPDAVGEVIPVTFGRSDPANGRFFKVPRIEYRNDTLALEDFIGTGDPGKITLFPAYAQGDADECDVLAGEETYNNPVSLVGMYVKNVEGDQEENSGVIRRISSYSLAGVPVSGYPDQLAIHFTFSEYFPKVIDSYHFGSLTWKAFLSIIDALLRYALDYAPCECFLGGIDFYVRSDENMIRVADVGATQAVSNIPDYQLSVSISSEEVGDVSSFKIIPVAGLEPYLNADSGLELYGLPTYHHPLDTSNDPVAGLFVEDSSGMSGQYQPVISGPSDFGDRDYDTYYRYFVYANGAEDNAHALNYYIALKVTFPEIDTSIEFDKVYLGIRMNSAYENFNAGIIFNESGKFEVMHRRYYGGAVKPIENTDVMYRVFAGRNEVVTDSLPDDYYMENAPSTKNKPFYYMEGPTDLGVGPNPNRVTGYKSFDLQLSDREAYDNTYEVIILLYRWQEQDGTPVYTRDITDIHELAIIFEKNITIGEELYA